MFRNSGVVIGTTVGAVFLLAGMMLFTQGRPASPATEKSVSSDSSLSQKSTIDAVITKKLAGGEKPNRLINEKSPYLLQHAFNPVDWHPWGEEAFEKARKEDKPIFLSIGYSTCYWCHVMEREVFENDSIAALMNNYVISIKVDREERPDVDRVYMTALNALTGSGGWPMSMFLTPDLKPFFGGTYIPPTEKYGRASFPDILTRIHELWTTRRGEITGHADRVGEYLQQASAPEGANVRAGTRALESGFESFSKSYDHRNAGFSTAPKFPRPVAFNFLLRYYGRTGENRALEMSLETLRRMHSGGMYDHIGGGFHRYATDERWHVPHFEKMLYDQALLVLSYLEASQITHDTFYADVAHDVLRYVSREMTHPAGAFSSAEDAESATHPATPDVKKEGAFYTWTKKEIDGILTPEEAGVFHEFFGVQEEGNVIADPHNEFSGSNILHVVRTRDEVAARFGKGIPQIHEALASARGKLFEVRAKRPRPHLDDKILVSWNGLMISAYARAYQVLGRQEYLTAAMRASTFILEKMYDEKTKTLLRRYRDGEARYEAHLEDFAFFTQGLIDLYEASFDIRWLQKAIELTDRQISLFYDGKNGGFYDITGMDKTILFRTKESYDGAEPSGNSIAILNLLRLSQMTNNERYGKMAEESLAYFGQRMLNAPHAMPQFLVALDFHLSKPKQIVIAGRHEDRRTQAILKEVHSRFIPNKVILLADGDEGQKILTSFIPFIGSITMIDQTPTAYVCENYACELPTSEVTVLAKLLDGRGRGK